MIHYGAAKHILLLVLTPRYKSHQQPRATICFHLDLLGRVPVGIHADEHRLHLDARHLFNTVNRGSDLLKLLGANVGTEGESEIKQGKLPCEEGDRSKYK